MPLKEVIGTCRDQPVCFWTPLWVRSQNRKQRLAWSCLIQEEPQKYTFTHGICIVCWTSTSLILLCCRMLPCCGVPCRAVLCCAVLCCAVPCHAVLCRALVWRSMLWCVALCCVVPWRAVVCQDPPSLQEPPLSWFRQGLLQGLLDPFLYNTLHLCNQSFTRTPSYDPSCPPFVSNPTQRNNNVTV